MSNVHFRILAKTFGNGKTSHIQYLEVVGRLLQVYKIHFFQCQHLSVRINIIKMQKKSICKSIIGMSLGQGRKLILKCSLFEN